MSEENNEQTFINKYLENAEVEVEYSFKNVDLNSFKSCIRHIKNKEIIPIFFSFWYICHKKCQYSIIWWNLV